MRNTGIGHTLKFASSSLNLSLQGPNVICFISTASAYRAVNFPFRLQHDTQCTYNVKLWRVRVTAVVTVTYYWSLLNIYILTSFIPRIVMICHIPTAQGDTIQVDGQAVAYRGGVLLLTALQPLVGFGLLTEGGLGCSTPPPEILKALQNRAKLNPIVKTVKNC